MKRGSILLHLCMAFLIALGLTIAGCGGESSSSNFPVITAPPSAPQSLNATAGDSQVTLRWEPPADNGGLEIEYYKIYRGTDSGNETFVGKTADNSTTYRDTGLTNDQTYYYEVSAVNADGEGLMSNEVYVTPRAYFSPIWQMFRYNARRTGQSHCNTSNNGTLKWKYPTNEGIKSSPAIDYDGTVYIGSYDYYLYALNPDGTLKWKFLTGGSIYSSPAIASNNGTVYVGSDDGYLYAISFNGTLKWKFSTNGQIKSSPAIDENGTIYVGSYDGYLYALNPDGTLKWKYKTEGKIESSPAIDENGTIYVGAYDESLPKAYLYAIYSNNGTKKWEWDTDGVIFSSPAIGKDDTIYVGINSEDGHLYAINPDGTEKWDYKIGALIGTSPAIAYGGAIYFGTYDGHLYALYSNGTQKWDYEIGDTIKSSPAIGKDGTIYVGSWDGYLYAIGPK